MNGLRRALLCLVVLFSAELGRARPSAADEADLLSQRVRVDIGGMVAVGGLVGSLIKTERWERVPLSTVSARVRPAGRGVRADVVWTF